MMSAQAQIVEMLGDKSLSREESMRKICQLTAEVVSKANRISLWSFGADRTEIRCLMCFNKNTNEFSSGQILHRKDLPEYFESIVENEVVSASHARQNNATRCFNELYFEPNDIYSLLDFIIHKNFVPSGIICCESVAKQVDWDTADVEHLRSIAVLISFFFEVS